ncbi:putative beta-hexosaminidase [Trichinella spiralis]|uniref:Beta-hexosaminidase n=1 Tax=Trichinella spiralis TaxID=6334 RepID=A0ABR3K6W0_TRISP
MLFCTSLFLGILVDLVRAQIQSIHCYYCASPMPPQTDDYEKHVAKLFFSKLFSLPPISDNCNDATPDALLKLNKQTCQNSNCTKITVTTEEFKFTIRGCKDGMLKNPHKLQNAACLADQSPTEFTLFGFEFNLKALLMLNIGQWKKFQLPLDCLNLTDKSSFVQ